MISLLINNGSTLKQTLPPATSNIPMATDILLPTINVNNYAVQGQI